MNETFSNSVILAGEDLERVDGYITVRDGTIEEIGEGAPVGSGKDMHRGIIIPPFVNAHTHLGDSVAKEIYLEKSQPEAVGPWSKKFESLRSSSKESKIRAIRSTMKDMLSTGTIAHCDFREEGIEGVRLLKEAKIPRIKPVVLSRPEHIEELQKILKESEGIGLPSIDSFRGEDVKEIAGRTRKAGKIFAVHVAETLESQRSSELETGRTEVQRALDMDPSFLVHGTWTTRDDLKAMHEKGVPLTICGRSNSLLSVGVPPIKEAMEEGVELWIGTDNATICQPDMFRELSFLWAILRQRDSRVGSEEARALLKAATVDPISDLGLPFGAIEEGANACFMVISRGENLRWLDDIYAGLVNRARPSNIKMIVRSDEIIHGPVENL